MASGSGKCSQNGPPTIEDAETRVLALDERQRRNDQVGAVDCDLATALDAEAPNMVRAMSTADHREAAAAFVEKRSPNFIGE